MGLGPGTLPYQDTRSLYTHARLTAFFCLNMCVDGLRHTPSIHYFWQHGEVLGGLSTLDKKGTYRPIALQWLSGMEGDLGGHGVATHTIGTDLVLFHSL